MLHILPFLLVYALLTFYLVREDIRAGILPDKFLCPLLWAGLVFHLCLYPMTLPSAVAGAVAGYAGFAAIYWCYRWIYKKEGLGYGDVKYLAALGAWHGWCVLPAIALCAALMASMYILSQMLLHPEKQVQKNPLPFGPFMAVAGLLMGWQSLITLPL